MSRLGIVLSAAALLFAAAAGTTAAHPANLPNAHVIKVFSGLVNALPTFKSAEFTIPAHKRYELEFRVHYTGAKFHIAIDLMNDIQKKTLWSWSQPAPYHNGEIVHTSGVLGSASVKRIIEITGGCITSGPKPNGCTIDEMTLSIDK